MGKGPTEVGFENSSVTFPPSRVYVFNDFKVFVENKSLNAPRELDGFPFSAAGSNDFSRNEFN